MGVPPTVGFISEFFIFQGTFGTAVAVGSSLRLFLSFLSLLASLLTFGYALWTVKRIFFGKLPPHLQEVKEPGGSVLYPMLALCVLSVALGIFPFLLDRTVELLRATAGGGA
jgi:NADH-quinone oxidoreductase subunit M